MQIPKQIGGYKIKIDNKHPYYATTDPRKKTITINKKKNLRAGGNEELMDTLEHEAFHVMNPEASEEEVHKAMKKKYKKYSGMALLKMCYGK